MSKITEVESAVTVESGYLISAFWHEGDIQLVALFVRNIFENFQTF